MKAALQTDQLSIARGGSPVLCDISLSMARGEMVALLGANGSGKTTLLRALLGLIRPQTGSIMLDGRAIANMSRKEIARRIAYVPQSHRPVFPFTVAEMVQMGLAPTLGWGRYGLGGDAIGRAIEQMGIGHLTSRFFAELSGGEQQSVLIARALAQGAEILLLDEPTSALDMGQRIRLLVTLEMLTSQGFLVLATTHDAFQASSHFTRAVMLYRGRIIADGPSAGVLDAQLLTRCYDLPASVSIEGHNGISWRADRTPLL